MKKSGRWLLSGAGERRDAAKRQVQLWEMSRKPAKGTPFTA